MKNIEKPHQSPSKEKRLNSLTVLEEFYLKSLQEMYYAELQIEHQFSSIKDRIISTKLIAILNTHFIIHLKHMERLEKIFASRNESIEAKNCGTFDALLSEGLQHLSIFDNDIENWEIALILVSQKLTHYKIASYSGLAHLAIKLNYHNSATLLAFSVQEEEDFIANNLDGIIDSFLAANVEGYKK